VYRTVDAGGGSKELLDMVADMMSLKKSKLLVCNRP
jgi:hypothetical protein